MRDGESWLKRVEYKGFHANIQKFYGISNNLFIGDVEGERYEYFSFYGYSANEAEQAFHQMIDEYWDIFGKRKENNHA